MRTLILVRHGSTPYNAKGLIQGRKDVDLSEDGLKEAAELKSRLDGESFDGAYSSELIRARRTAQIILEGRDIELIIDPRLNEIDQGEWTNRSGRKLFLTDSRYRLWATRPMEAHPPGGETFLDVARRAASFLVDVRGSRPLVVAHGGLIAVIRALAGEAPLEKAWSLLIKNAQIVKVKLPDNGRLKEIATNVGKMMSAE